MSWGHTDAVGCVGLGGTACPHFFNSPEFRLGNFAPGEGKKKKAQSYPKNWGVEGHTGCMGGSLWMQGGLGVSASIPGGRGAEGWAVGVGVHSYGGGGGKVHFGVLGCLQGVLRGPKVSFGILGDL